MMFVLYAFGINIVMAPFNVAGGTVAGDMGTIYGSYYLIMAMFMLGSDSLLYYLPILMITGIVSGVIIGMLGGMVIPRLKRIIKL